MVRLPVWPARRAISSTGTPLSDIRKTKARQSSRGDQVGDPVCEEFATDVAGVELGVVLFLTHSPQCEVEGAPRPSSSSTGARPPANAVTLGHLRQALLRSEWLSRDGGGLIPPTSAARFAYLQGSLHSKLPWHRSPGRAGALASSRNDLGSVAA